jgi:hypothetical protein
MRVKKDCFPSVKFDSAKEKGRTGHGPPLDLNAPRVTVEQPPR